MGRTAEGINYFDEAPKSFNDLKKGTKFIVVNNTSTHNYPLHRVLTLNKSGKGHTGSMSNVAEEVFGNGIRINDIRLVKQSESIDDLKATLKDAKDNYESVKTSVEAKLAFCERLGVASVDDTMIKAYNLIMEMSTTDDMLEKVNILSKEL